MIIFEQSTPVGEDGVDLLIVRAREMAASHSLEGGTNNFYMRYLVTVRLLAPLGEKLIEERLFPEGAQPWEAQRHAMRRHDQLVKRFGGIAKDSGPSTDHL